MSALTMLQVMRANLAGGAPIPPREDLIRALDEIEEALSRGVRQFRVQTAQADALLALADQGEGSTPMQLGTALDPSKEGYHAGALGTARLSALRQAGFAEKAHFGWWVLTDDGRREVERLRALQGGRS